MEKWERYNWDITDEEIELLRAVGLPPDLAVRLREVLDKESKRIYNIQTNEFLAQQAGKIRRETDPEKLMALMYEVVNWKENYKSPYKVES